MSDPVVGKDPFEEARQEYKRLSLNQSWFPVFGDLYIRRYPNLSRRKKLDEAGGITHSIMEADDSVHAFEASGVRQAIIQRIIEGENRGFIRPWYTDAGLWAESSNILRATPEEDIDYLCRGCLTYPEEFANGKYRDVCLGLLEKLDPPTEGKTDFELAKIREDLIPWLRPQIEIFSIVKGLERSLYPLSREDFDSVANIVLDPDKADIVFRKRLIDPDNPSERVYPLIGEGHPEVRIKENFVLKYIALEDAKFYRKRVGLLWLYSLLMTNDTAQKYMQEKGASLLDELEVWLQTHNQTILDVLWKALGYSKFEKVFLNLGHKFRSEYASKANFRVYASGLYHLLRQRREAISPFEHGDFPIPVDISRFEEKNILIEFGQKMIDSVIQKLGSQIPAPRGLAHHQRAIMAKRLANLEREVAPKHIREEIISKTLECANFIDNPDGAVEIEKLIRVAYDTLMPRGQNFFEELKAIVDAALEEVGGLELYEELDSQVDIPQSLIKQYGPEAMRQARNLLDDPDKMSYIELYGIVLSLKSVELLFDEATLNPLQKNNVLASLYEDYFLPQLKLLNQLEKQRQELEALLEPTTENPPEEEV
ncbi:MAG: hypothetical protein D6813_09930 [Calditrichaeota bacterium]|nr:MAG: hypothetical protein D6813_09930 [Calditrichota bacterium]